MGIILRIRNNRHLFSLLMRTNSSQTLQQLIAFDRNETLLKKSPRKQRVPDRVHVQNRMGLWPLAIDHRVQPRLGGRLALSRNGAALWINLQQIGGRQRALVQASRRD